MWNENSHSVQAYENQTAPELTRQIQFYRRLILIQKKFNNKKHSKVGDKTIKQTNIWLTRAEKAWKNKFNAGYFGFNSSDAAMEKS